MDNPEVEATVPALGLVRPATPADAKFYADAWAASPEANALTALYPWPPHDEAMFEAYLKSPGYRGYISDGSDEGLLIIRPQKLPEKNVLAEEPFFWLVASGLTDPEHDEAMRQLFLMAYSEAKHKWAFGDLPPNARDRSFAWARSWREEEVKLKNGWIRLMCRVDVALERLRGLQPRSP